jgi:hypothetical protein
MCVIDEESLTNALIKFGNNPSIDCASTSRHGNSRKKFPSAWHQGQVVELYGVSPGTIDSVKSTGSHNVVPSTTFDPGASMVGSVVTHIRQAFPSTIKNNKILSMKLFLN